ncbi:hypothetical protein CYMTET_22837, partial [Cymbomonas tetramitiformis]
MHDGRRPSQYLLVVPVLLLDFLAMSSTRGVIPTLIMESFGGSRAFAVGVAYIADLVPAEKRPAAFGVAFGVGMGVAMMIGPISGGLIASHYGNRVMFAFSVMIALANLVYTWALLPESLDRTAAAPQKLDWSAANPFKCFQMLWKNPLLRRLALVTLLYYTALWGVVGNILLYAVHRFNYSRIQSAILLSLFGAVNIFVQVVVVRVLSRYMDNFRLLVLGLMGGALNAVLLGLTWNGAVLYVCMPCLAWSTMSFTAIS